MKSNATEIIFMNISHKNALPDGEKRTKNIRMLKISPEKKYVCLQSCST